jgi:hypothetical protein
MKRRIPIERSHTWSGYASAGRKEMPVLSTVAEPDEKP